MSKKKGIHTKVPQGHQKKKKGNNWPNHIKKIDGKDEKDKKIRFWFLEALLIRQVDGELNPKRCGLFGQLRRRGGSKMAH